MELVNTQTVGDQRTATVTSLEGGGYVVAWRGPAYSGEAIWFQQYDASGEKVGPETWAKDVAPSSTEVPRLVGLEGGRFLVNDKLYDAAGIPTGGGTNVSLAFRYGITPESDFLSESDPTITGLPGGGYATVEPKDVYVQGSSSPVRTFVLRWFDESGHQTRAVERPLEGPGVESSFPPSAFGAGVVALADGKLLVTWQESGRRTSAGEFELYSPTGQMIEHEVVALRGTVTQLSATPLPDGGFIIAWAGANYMASPNGFYQRYDANGARVGEPVDLGPVSYSFDGFDVASTATTTDGDAVLAFETREYGTGLDIAVHEVGSSGGGGEEPPPPTGDGQVINSPGPGSTVNGTPGNDTINASQGADVLTGGAGADSFAYAALPWSAGRITDFVVGTDRLDLSAIFRASGYTGSDPVGDGRMRLESDGSGGTKVFFDRDAPNSGDWPFHITTLQGVSPAGLTWVKLSAGGANNPPPSGNAIGFTATTSSVFEGSAGFHNVAVATVTRASAEGSATVEWRLDPSGANPVDSVDFSGGGSRPGAGIVSFAAGETSKQIAFTINGDTTVEPDETFTLTLSNPQNGTLETSSVVVTLKNDDSAQPPPSDSGQVLTSDQYGDTLIGGPGADTLNAGQGPDKLTGAGGADHFVFGKLPWVRGEISDFTPGQDVLDLSALAPGYAGTDPIRDGYLIFRDSGGSTEVFVDVDGAGGEWPFGITLLRGVVPGSLSPSDFIF